jgi:hypothetical protein
MSSTDLLGEFAATSRAGKLGAEIKFRETDGFADRLEKLAANPRVKRGAKRESVSRLAFRIGLAVLEEMEREGLL